MPFLILVTQGLSAYERTCEMNLDQTCGTSRTQPCLPGSTLPSVNEAWDGVGWTGTFEALMTGEATDTDTWVSPTAAYPWGRVYGGQVVAQALWACGQTVDPAYVPHSLHAYFIRGGLSDRPITFKVERTRDGRSFMTRHVIGYQDDKVMLEQTASFHTPETHEPNAVTAEAPYLFPVDSGTPECGEEVAWSPFFTRLPVEQGLGATGMWAKFGQAVRPTRLMQACAVAFVSDDVPTEAVRALHPELRDLRWNPDQPDEFRNRFMSASLDHAIWFHQIEPVDAWQLHAFTSEIVANGRGLSSGRVFNTSGQLLATVMQEVLLRTVLKK